MTFDDICTLATTVPLVGASHKHFKLHTLPGMEHEGYTIGMDRMLFITNTT